MANGHGGHRKGSGRKPGPATRKSRDVADRAPAEAITPLEVLLQAMRKHPALGDLDKAAVFAQGAAPYCHPRLGSITLRGDQDAPLRLVEELIVVYPGGRMETSAASHSRTNGVPLQ